MFTKRIYQTVLQDTTRVIHAIIFIRIRSDQYIVTRKCFVIDHLSRIEAHFYLLN